MEKFIEKLAERGEMPNLEHFLEGVIKCAPWPGLYFLRGSLKAARASNFAFQPRRLLKLTQTQVLLTFGCVVCFMMVLLKLAIAIP